MKNFTFWEGLTWFFIGWLKGDVFGNWVILGDAPFREYIVRNGARRGRVIRNKYVFAQCKCGTIKEVALYDLRNGRNKMCRNCSNKIKREKYKLNNPKFDLRDNYGNWTVLYAYKLSRCGKNRTLFCLCKCKCGIEKYIKACALRTGRSKMCANCHLRNLNGHSRNSRNN